MVKDNKANKKDIFFTCVIVDDVIPVGFTDLLTRWKSVYALGSSLGYKYVHTPLQCKNTPKIYRFLGIEDIFTETVDTFLDLGKGNRRFLYERMGFEQPLNFLYPQGKTSWRRRMRLLLVKAYEALKLFRAILVKTIFFRDIVFVDITVDRVFLENNNIDSFDRLEAVMRTVVSRKGSSDKRVFVRLRFHLSGPPRKAFYDIMSDVVQVSSKEMGLDHAYQKAREHDPVKGAFLPGKIKVLVHIRQGDTALIETPWNTFIPVYGYKKFTQLESRDEGGWAEFMGEEEYYEFVREVLSQFNGSDFSFVISSDGYSKPFDLIFNNADSIGLSDGQVAQLKSAEKQYLKKFDMFKALGNVELFVGEEYEKLCCVIDSMLEADIVVVGFRNTLGMVPKVLAHYRAGDRDKLLIQLFKQRHPFDVEKLLGLKMNVINCRIDEGGRIADNETRERILDAVRRVERRSLGRDNEGGS